MDITGLWKVEKGMRFTEEGLVYSTKEEVLAADPEADVEVFDMQYLFGADGSVAMVVKIPEGTPEEQIEAALQEEGYSRVGEDQIAIKESPQWKAEVLG